MTPLFDQMLQLPSIVIAAIVLVVWGGIAFAIHRILVPWVCGADGRRLGRFEAEVTSQVALAFGLLVSFNAVWIWERGDRVREAVLAEATALDSILDEAEFSSTDPAQRGELQKLTAAYSRAMIEVEWPRLSTGTAERERPVELRALRRFGTACSEAVLDGVKRVESAREIRIREGQTVMPRSRWLIVFLLAVLTLVSIGTLHGDSPRGRVLALTLVTLAISFCFIVLFVSGRPFVGEYSIQPVALREVLARAER